MTYGVDPLAAEAADPRTAPARLAELAAAFPHLHPLIDANPACYPALRDWMRQIAAAQQPAPAQQPGPVQQVQQPVQQPEAPQQHRAVASPPSQAAHRQMFGTPVEQGLLERAYTPVDDEAAARRKRRRILFIVLGIVLTLLLAAGTTFGILYATGTVMGGRSPEQAAQRFALGAGNADPLAVLGATAPSEADHLRAPIERLLELDLGPAGTGAEAAAQLRTAISLQLEEAEYGVEPLGEGIALVTPVAGTAVLDGDPAELAAVLTALAEPALRAGLEVPLPATEAEREAADAAEAEGEAAEEQGAAEAEPEAEEPVEPDVAVQDFRERAEALIAEQLPATIDLAGEDASGLAVVVVEEGTGWYASPLLTAAELRYRALGDEAPPRGAVRAADELPRYETPQLAAEALATGIVAALRGEGLDDAAAALSLPERRLVEIYGEALIAPELPELDLQVDALELTAREPAEGVGEQESQIGGSLELLIDGKPLTIGSGCSVLEEPVGDPDAEFQQTERIEHCLADRALLDGLGSDEWTPVALPEGDGWRVGGLATAGDVLGIVVERYTQLVAAGEVARLESSNDVDRSEE